MPTYEYECLKCGRVFDHFQRMTDDPLKRCILDGCRGKVRRLVSAGAGVIFKGTGFYETDYKKKTGTPEPEAKAEAKVGDAESKGEKKGGASSSAKSKSAPEKGAASNASKGD